MNLPEEQLLVYVRRVKNGDQDAFRKIEKAFEKEINKIAINFYLQGSREGNLNEDIVSVAKQALWNACKDYKEEHETPKGKKKVKFRTFAQLCFRRNVITLIINAKNNKHSVLNRAYSLDQPSPYAKGQEAERPYAEVLPDTRPSILDEIIRREEFESSFSALKSVLTPLENQVLDLYAEDERYDDISKAINRNYKAVDNSIGRIKKKATKINA